MGMPRPEERLQQYPHQLSGGLRQRVMIAMALSCEPKLLIADEPTTALDVTIQAQILDLIDELRQRLDMAVLLITHDMGVIASRTDRVMVMYAGKIIEGAGTADLFDTMRHPYSEALFESIPRLNQDRRERLYSIPGLPPDLGRAAGRVPLPPPLPLRDGGVREARTATVIGGGPSPSMDVASVDVTSADVTSADVDGDRRHRDRGLHGGRQRETTCSPAFTPSRRLVPNDCLSSGEATRT